MIPTVTSAPAAPASTAAQPDPLREKAIQLESFLFEELLRVSGVSSPSPSGGGDSQFESFLRRAQAEAVAGAGQTGLTEAIYRSLARSAGSPTGATGSA